MIGGKDDALSSILEIRRRRVSRPESDYPEAEGCPAPAQTMPGQPATATARGWAHALEQTPTSVDAQAQAEPPAAQAQASGSAIADAKARATRAPSPLIAKIRICPTSFSGNHEWVYPAQRRGAVDIYCRRCGHRKANR